MFNPYKYRFGAITAEEAQFELTANQKMTVQDLLELLITLPEEARRITMVECGDDGYEGSLANLTRNGIEFNQNEGNWTLELTGDIHAKERK